MRLLDDKNYNEVKPGVVHRAPGIYLTTEKKKRKTSARKVVMIHATSRSHRLWPKNLDASVAEPPATLRIPITSLGSSVTKVRLLDE